MARCDCCGNEYDKAMTITVGDETSTFDCFECAIHMLAPECEHCGCRIIGHGLESNGGMFCCASCARKEGEDALRDRAGNAPRVSG